MKQTDQPDQEPDQERNEADTWTVRAAAADVDATILALGGYWPPLANLARLVEECGELARGVNTRFGPKPLKPGEAVPDLEEELGDMLYTSLVLAHSLGVDAETALRRAIATARRRSAPPTGGA